MLGSADDRAEPWRSSPPARSPPSWGWRSFCGSSWDRWVTGSWPRPCPGGPAASPASPRPTASSAFPDQVEGSGQRPGDCRAAAAPGLDPQHHRGRGQPRQHPGCAGRPAPGRRRGLSLSSSHVGSMGGLMAVKRGLCHLAGSHLLDTQDGSYNVSYIKRYLPDMPVRLVNLVMRDQGLIVPRGNPKNIKGSRTWAARISSSSTARADPAPGSCWTTGSGSSASTRRRSRDTQTRSLPTWPWPWRS